MKIFFGKLSVKDSAELRKEIPYSVEIEVESFKTDQTFSIGAVIYVERYPERDYHRA
jgi:GTPase Era involved in 16S rRNA processing